MFSKSQKMTKNDQKNKKKLPKDIKLRHCEVVFPASFLASDQLDQIINSRNMITKWAWIIHDKDVYLFDDQDKIPVGKQVGDFKPPHYHIYLKFKDVCTDKHIAQWFGVERQSVEKIKGRLSDVLKYLTHANDQKKYQYSSHEIKANFDIQLAIRNDLNLPERLVEISLMIKNDQLTRLNYTDHLTNLEYCHYYTEIHRYWKYREDELKKDFVRNMECIYIYGVADAGKSTLAKEIADKNGLSFYEIEGSNDPLGNYAGEQCVIFNDLRYNSKSMTFDDILRMFDNHHSAKGVKSRYYNKFLQAKLCILTTTKPMEDFFIDYDKTRVQEDMNQFKRRFKTYIIMNEKNIEIYLWNYLTKEYVLKNKYHNYVYPKYHDNQPFDDHRMEQQLHKSLGTNFLNSLQEEDLKYKKKIDKKSEDNSENS
jgi:hypothetical protein